MGKHCSVASYDCSNVACLVINNNLPFVTFEKLSSKPYFGLSLDHIYLRTLVQTGLINLIKLLIWNELLMMNVKCYFRHIRGTKNRYHHQPVHQVLLILYLFRSLVFGLFPAGLSSSCIGLVFSF